MLALILCFFFNFLFVFWEPFKAISNSRFATTLSYSLTLFFLFALMVKAGATSTAPAQQFLYGALLVLLLFTAVAIVVLEVVMYDYGGAAILASNLRRLRDRLLPRGKIQAKAHNFMEDDDDDDDNSMAMVPETTKRRILVPVDTAAAAVVVKLEMALKMVEGELGAQVEHIAQLYDDFAEAEEIFQDHILRGQRRIVEAETYLAMVERADPRTGTLEDQPEKWSEAETEVAELYRQVLRFFEAVHLA